MKKRKWIFMIILVSFFIMCNPSIINAKTTDISFVETSKTPQPVFSVADAEGPVIGTPSLDDLTPDSDQDVDVMAPISDEDGVKNATLFWQYTSINTTLFDSNASSPTPVDVVDIVDTAFDLAGAEVGYVTALGDKTPFVTNWRYGEYTYNGAVSEINLRIAVTRELVYVLIRGRNSTTGEWQTMYEVGGYALDADDDLDTVTYQNSTPTLGYYILAVSYDDQEPVPNPRIPRFDWLTISHEEYDWTVPAADAPTFVDYYITAFDTLNQSSTSPTYTFLMDYTPVATLLDVPSVLASNEDYVLNVSVTDADGAGTINKSSVVAYYQFVGDMDWSIVKLNHVLEISGVHFFNGTIPAGNLGNVETYMVVRVNASDIVDGQKGREDTTGDRWIRIDSLAPRVSNIMIDGGVSVPNLENVTLTSSQVYIEATFEDARGIESVYMYYSLPNGTSWVKEEMVNTTSIGPYDTSSTFNVTLPSSNETMFVEYFFETKDFFGNIGNTSLVNFYYSDGSGPNLDILTTYPSIISNYTNVLVLFNSTDFSGLMQPVLWYSLDNKTTWIPVGAIPIDYPSLVDYKDPFTATDLHFIENNAITSYPLEIIRNGPVDTAILSFEIEHELPTDIRVWLKLEDRRRFLLFDREPGSNTITRDIDLINLGITEADFNKANFTLEIEDLSDLYSGKLTKYEIEIKHHSVPLGYQYIAMIPASLNDTTVFFYINMTDRLWNSENTTTFDYYSDGLAPKVNVIDHKSTIELAGDYFIPIYATIEDQGGIFGADAYYRFSEEDEWMIGAMSLNSTSGSYSFDVPIPNASGIMYYKIRAFDFAGLSNETEIFITTFSNGLAPFIELIGIPYPVPLDMNGTNTIRVWANVTDDGTITNCTIGYQFDSGEVINEDMIFDNKTGLYYLDIEVPKRSGNLTYIVYARDNLDLTTESDPYTIVYENAGTTPGLPTDLILFGALLAVGGGGSVAGVAYLYKKGKLKVPGRGD
ncbi:MAG: hypothetical protein ACFFC6_11945 [Promethearchaeota archaeon]